MKDDRSSLPVRIRASELRQVSPWQLPDMTDAERDRLVALAQKPEPEPEPEPEPIVEVEVSDDEVYAEKLTLEQWEELCEQARQEGLSQGLEEGRKQGHAEGFEAGKAEGLAAAKAEVDQQLQLMRQLFDNLRAPLTEQQNAIEHQLVQLVVQLGEAVIHHTITTESEVIQSAIREALELIPADSGKLIIQIHPSEYPILQPLLENDECELVPDASVTAGGCVVVSGSCRVDAQLETRFKQIADQLLANLIPQTDNTSGDA